MNFRLKQRKNIPTIDLRIRLTIDVCAYIKTKREPNLWHCKISRVKFKTRTSNFDFVIYLHEYL